MEHADEGLFDSAAYVEWSRGVKSNIYIYLFLHFKMYFCESLALFYYIHFLSGKPAEVYWVTTADHRGGYAYRICKV